MAFDAIPHIEIPINIYYGPFSVSRIVSFPKCSSVYSLALECHFVLVSRNETSYNFDLKKKLP